MSVYHDCLPKTLLCKSSKWGSRYFVICSTLSKQRLNLFTEVVIRKCTFNRNSLYVTLQRSKTELFLVTYTVCSAGKNNVHCVKIFSTSFINSGRKFENSGV